MYKLSSHCAPCILFNICNSLEDITRKKITLLLAPLVSRRPNFFSFLVLFFFSSLPTLAWAFLAHFPCDSWILWEADKETAWKCKREGKEEGGRKEPSDCDADLMKLDRETWSNSRLLEGPILYENSQLSI